MKPRLAILFWFYKELELCAERLQLLRRLNPGVPIYGLFGGAAEDAGAARRLEPELDDLYLFDEEHGPEWRWRHGDRLIATWMRDRGGDLAWDTLVVVQWDMLLLRPVSELFGILDEGEALFSGLRPMSEVEAWWGWARAPEKRPELEAFQALLAERYGYREPLWACLFIVVCLPRRFLQLYVEAGPPTQGFLEYKTPTLARVFGVPMRRDHPFQPWWAADPETRDLPRRARLLNAVGEEPSLEEVLRELAAPDGARVIHPYRGPFPPHLVGASAGAER